MISPMPRPTTKQNHLSASSTPATTYSQNKKHSRLTNPLGNSQKMQLLETQVPPTCVLEKTPPHECIHTTTRVKVKNPMMLGTSLEDLSPLLPYGWNWQVSIIEEMDDACKTTFTTSGFTHNATVHWTDWAEQTSPLNPLFRNTVQAAMKMPSNPYTISYLTVFVTTMNDPYSIKNSNDIRTTCHTFYHTLQQLFLCSNTFIWLADWNRHLGHCSENQLPADTK